MKDDEFVRLTGKILKMTGLTSTDKIVLAYNLGMPRFFASPQHMADTLGMTVSTVKKSVLKLRRLGLWREGKSYRGSQAKDTRVTEKDTGVADGVTRVTENRSFSPMKPPVLIERRLERDKKEGIESAAGAAELSGSAQTLLKKLGEENPVTSVTLETKSSVSSTTAGEALNVIGTQGHVPLAVPLGADGRPLTRQEMCGANFLAEFDGKPRPYSDAQVAAGRDASSWKETTPEEFDSLFSVKAG